jgi:hypothetical protein
MPLGPLQRAMSAHAAAASVLIALRLLKWSWPSLRSSSIIPALIPFHQVHTHGGTLDEATAKPHPPVRSMPEEA